MNLINEFRAYYVESVNTTSDGGILRLCTFLKLFILENYLFSLFQMDNVTFIIR